MSNKAEQIQEELNTDDNDYDEGDYGFIISPTGDLKTMMIPEDLMENPPLSVKKILKIFGIKNLHQLEPRTLH